MGELGLVVGESEFVGVIGVELAVERLAIVLALASASAFGLVFVTASVTQ